MRVKILQAFLYVFLASILASSAYGATFDVYVKTNYKNQPDLSKYGVKDLAMIHPSKFWKAGEDRQLLPPKDHVTKYVSGTYANYAGLLAPDIEHWPLIGSDTQIKSRVQKFITLLEWIKSAAPKAKVGYYGVVPANGYAQLLLGPSHPLFKEWQRKNNLAQPLADRVDAFFPNLYSVEANQANWVKAAVAKINEVKRLGKGKPIYPFINPRYRPAAYGDLPFKPVPKDYIALQLKTIKAQGASGVVIWGADNAKSQWSESLPWWQATKEFLGLK